MPEEKYELIITEKPKVSQRVAEALATGKVTQVRKGKVSYYVIERKSKKIVIAPAVGHVFTLTQESGAADYPIFNIKWVPSYEVGTGAKFTKPYVDVIKQLAKKADSFTAACDYDIEGELIGYNVIKYLCGEEALKNAKRMKFSALTKDELVRSYENKNEHLDFPLADAGVTRHMLDWFWGINTSRALSYAYKSQTGGYATLSAGRVQTPTLKILDEKEKEIRKFVPKPYWVLTAHLGAPEKELPAIHETDKFFDKAAAETAYNNAKGQDAVVSEIKKQKSKQNPPNPFNLGDLQSEAYAQFKYAPKRTQSIAQNLYEQGLISYPRTSSQKLPQGVNPKELLKPLEKQPAYKKLISELLDSGEPIKPNEGSKTDPAHPCIHPTGEVPAKIADSDAKLYDLIVKRFLACFGKPAVRENQEIRFQIDGETFLSKGAVTLEENWFMFYRPYVKLKEEELPDLKENDTLKVKKLDKEEKETKPPNRYSQASIIKKMEQLGIGTKATRATILQTLYDRNYVEGDQMKVTDFGSKIVETIVKFAPELASEELTRKFESEVEQIQDGSLKSEAVISEAKEALTKIMNTFKKHNAEIGAQLGESYREAARKQSTLGKCPKCNEDLIVRRAKASGKQFVGCSGYPKCDCSYPLPQMAKIVPVKNPCPHDGLPVVEVIRKGKRKFAMCIDPACPSKADWGKKKEAKPTSAKPQSLYHSQPKPV
ncbi:MAG: DNA topoisomerase I [archaeon]